MAAESHKLLKLTKKKHKDWQVIKGEKWRLELQTFIFQIYVIGQCFRMALEGIQIKCYDVSGN